MDLIAYLFNPLGLNGKMLSQGSNTLQMQNGKTLSCNAMGCLKFCLKACIGIKDCVKFNCGQNYLQ